MNVFAKGKTGKTFQRLIKYEFSDENFFSKTQKLQKQNITSLILPCFYMCDEFY